MKRFVRFIFYLLYIPFSLPEYLGKCVIILYHAVRIVHAWAFEDGNIKYHKENIRFILNGLDKNDD